MTHSTHHHDAAKTITRDSDEVAKARCVDDYSEVMRREKPADSVLLAYAPKPVQVAFDAQIKNEQVILLLRQHPIFLLKPFIIVVIALFFPMIMNASTILDFLPERFHLAFNIGWYLLVFGFALESFLVWFFNVYLVTDERIIDVDFLSLIYKNVSTAKIDNIEDVTVTASGAFASIFDYGTVLIQTAAEKTQFEFENVPHPTKVAALLNEMMLEEEREKLEGRAT
jgi:uncharacterized membrane protein YdbT with pleckstrin-like domain